MANIIEVHIYFNCCDTVYMHNLHFCAENSVKHVKSHVYQNIVTSFS
jgi:hypothetical protein